MIAVNRRNARRIGSVAVTVALASAAMGAVAPGSALASPAATCSEGSRSETKEHAANNDFVDAVPEVSWTTQGSGMGGPEFPYFYRVSLRYNASSGCSWALLGLGNFFSYVWLERQQSGGAVERLGERSVSLGNNSTYTGMFASQSPYSVRACGKDSASGVHCTDWFSG